MERVLVGMAAIAALASCTPEAHEPATVATTTTASASASAAPTLAPFRADLRASRLEQSWEPSPESGVPIPIPAGTFVGAETSPGAKATLPRAALLATQTEFPVDLAAAIDAIETLARRTLADREREMKDVIEVRRIAAPPESIVGPATDVAYSFAYLAPDRKTLTLVVRRTMRIPIQGPLVKAPEAHCLPGQPCAQMADTRANLSTWIAVQVRYVVAVNGSLVEDTLFVPRTM